MSSGWAAKRPAAADLTVVVAATAVAGVCLLLAASDGGFSPTTWLPAALFVALLLGVLLWYRRPAAAGAATLALAALAAFTLWCGASVAWAGVRGDAWNGADLTLLYLCAFALFAFLPWRVETTWYFTALFSVGTTALTLFQFARLARDPAAYAGLFVSGRLATPVSYPNADCALLFMAAVPALVLASRRRVPLLLRGVLLASAGIAIELAIACQSRMSLIAVPLIVAATALLVRDRVRLLFTALPLLAAVAFAARPILRLYDATLGGTDAKALHHALSALLVSGALLLVAGWALAAADAKLPRSQLTRRASLAVALLVVAGGLVLAAVLASSAVPHPGRSLHRQWDSFVHGDAYSDYRTSHFTSSGTNRYDIWRVAAREFRHHPVAGVGVDNFSVDYLRERRSSESPLYPHSLLLRIPAQTGIVGTALFAVFLAAAFVAARRRRWTAPEVDAAATAALLAFLYFVIHGSVDWFWEIPAVGLPAFAFLGIAVGIGARAEDGRIALPRWATAAAVAVAAAAIALPWLSARETSLAASGWVSDTPLAYDRLRLAARVDPLSDVPAETEGLIAARSGDRRRAIAAFGRAIDRNRSNWYAHLELALMQHALGHRAQARAEATAAQTLNPRDPTVQLVARRIRSGRPITQAAVDARFDAADRASGGSR